MPYPSFSPDDLPACREASKRAMRLAQAALAAKPNSDVRPHWQLKGPENCHVHNNNFVRREHWQLYASPGRISSPATFAESVGATVVYAQQSYAQQISAIHGIVKLSTGIAT